MLFNSIEYLLFLPIVLAIYWLLKNRNIKWQNILLLASSYFFYAWWDPRFLFLLIFSTGLDYYSGIKIANALDLNIKKIWLLISIIINLGFLGFFKYYNFFADSLAELLIKLGFQVNFWSLNVILPVGISFYTFHGISYIIDIYKDRIKPENNFITYSLFVSYFPLLVAGPIERATHLLPQLKIKRILASEKFKSGLHLIIYGLFKKIVIADSCAIYANDIFSNNESMNSLSLFLGVLYFSFQIYGDFSGYSDIAIGTSRLFGIELLRNFKFPYFSRDIAEFWRRWHISLSSWFRDYLYIPLGGSKKSKLLSVRNTIIIFLVSGFWHGANWTFLAWGGLNALYFMPLLLNNKNRNNLDTVAAGKILPNFKELIYMLFTFFLVLISWIFFRSKTIFEAFYYIKSMFSLNLKGGIQRLNIERYSVELIFLLFIFILLEWYSREHEHPFIGKFKNFNYIIVIFLIYVAGIYSNVNSFIYFQF